MRYSCSAVSTPAKTICRKCRLEYPGEALFCPNCGTAQVQEDSADPMVGTTIGERYVLLERMGQGGSGTIYRAEHVTLRRKVAVKVLHHELSRDDLAIERFRREATTVGQIENDHIVEIFDFGRTHDGRLYLAMELLEGQTLADLIEREGQLDVDRAVDILIQLSETLMEAHAMGYIHRDLRPRNVFLAIRRGKGKREFVKLLDFGLAKLVEKEGEAASTSLGMTFGDPHYMSPEQARGDALDRRADIYSLGCIAYEMLVGEPPFVGGKVFDILTRHVEATPDPPQARRSDVPTWLDRAVTRMLSKRADQRFITVYRVIEALRQGSDSGLIMSDDVARRQETVPPASVADAMARLGARAPADLAQGVARPAESKAEAAPTDEGRKSGERPAAGVAVRAPRVEGAAAARSSNGSNGSHGSNGRIGNATALGIGVGGVAAAAGKRGAPPPGMLSGGPPPVQAKDAVPPAKGGVSGGLSSAWYADGEAMSRAGADAEDLPIDEGPAPPPKQVRRHSPGDTGLLAREERVVRRPWLLAAVLGGAMALGALVVFALSSGDDDEAPVVAEAEEPAAPVEPAPAVVDAPALVEAEPAQPTPTPDESAAKPTEKKVAVADPEPAARGQARKARKRSAAPRPAAAEPDPDAAERDEADQPGAEPKPTEKQVDAGKAEFYARLGDRDLAGGDLLAAATNFNKARELDPRNPTAALGLGEIALGQGSTSAAVSHLRRAVKLRPGSSRAHTSLGEALLASGKRRDAAASFRRALKIEPGDARAQAGLDEATGGVRGPSIERANPGQLE